MFQIPHQNLQKRLIKSGCPVLQILKNSNKPQPAGKKISITKIYMCPQIICKIFRKIYCWEVSVILFESDHFANFYYKMSLFFVYG